MAVKPGDRLQPHGYRGDLNGIASSSTLAKQPGRAVNPAAASSRRSGLVDKGGYSRMPCLLRARARPERTATSPALPDPVNLCSVVERAGSTGLGVGRTPLRSTGRPMREILFFVVSSFWAGAAHAATPGHGKTIAAAYIVGARGKPVDALILGIFVTLSHTSGIVLVGVLASLGSTWLRPQRIEAFLAAAVGILVIVLGLWMLWTQRDLVALAMGEPGDAANQADAHTQDHAHDHAHDAAHDHPPGHGHGEP